MKCMCAQTRPRFILSSEGVLGGMEFEPMLTPREKSPLPKMSPEEDRTRNAVDSEPKHYQLSYSGPPKTFVTTLLHHTFYPFSTTPSVGINWQTTPHTRPPCGYTLCLKESHQLVSPKTLLGWHVYIRGVVEKEVKGGAAPLTDQWSSDTSELFHRGHKSCRHKRGR